MLLVIPITHKDLVILASTNLKAPGLMNVTFSKQLCNLAIKGVNLQPASWLRTTATFSKHKQMCKPQSREKSEEKKKWGKSGV